ncbi:hypothetical protein P171DRAFT_524146 [Karstenula rhodostoma CBS 690.94]|uniref:Uncharacterized protein n=1 Tax=Karstenula rhodostoma CBS 690.94 TaxID=1392251 RepID=A0A9P4U8R9_9PLEO|nr:hypothetical protein P171DRAFT_524146 [Karstenula rhodostoma CBS 690.94]
MSQPARSPREQTLPHDTGGNINVNAWAKANLDQDIINGTSEDPKVQQELLQSDFVRFASQRNADCLFVFHTEGYEFPIYAPYVRMTAQKYAQYGAHNMHPNPPTLTIDLPYHAWMVQAAITFWKTHKLVVPADDHACFAEETTPHPHPRPEERPSLLRLARMVNLATYTHDIALRTTIYATLRARLLSSTYTPAELLDAIKFVWCERPVSWERYEVVRRILLTGLLRVREKVCGVLEGYFQHVVDESGGEGGAFMTAFNLGQVWWEESGMRSE